jgi:transcriptional regulator with XRE-family HTH domain
MKNKNIKKDFNANISLKVSLKLKALRKLSDLTQKDVANALDLTPQQIACYEVGQTQLTLERFFEMCNIYKINPITVLKNAVENDTFENNKNDILLEQIEELEQVVKNMKNK